jgi:predicted ATPase
MLSKLRLRNFRGFRDHTVEFSKFAVIAGRNNAGKSTLIEAVSIIAEVLPKFFQGAFVRSRSWVGNDTVGVHLKLDQLSLRAATLFHRYRKPPASLTAEFDGGVQLSVIVGADGEAFIEGTLASGATVDSRATARKAEYPNIAVLPQISPLLEDETVLKASYVQSCLNTYRSSRQFRNQIRFNHQHFETFTELFHQTWENVRINSFDSVSADYQEQLSLLLSEDGFVAEASDFGHGLQMWLQIVWFLARTPEDHIVVLDEPDVYVHPEQQARILPILRGRYRQCLISTHSPAILTNTSTNETLRIHRATTVSRPGLTDAEHEVLVRQAIAALRQSELGVSDAIALEEATGDDFDTRTVEIRVIVYGDARFVLMDADGYVVIEIDAQGRERGRTARETLNVQRVSIETVHADDIEVFINDRQLPPDAIFKAQQHQVYLDLGDYAE